MALGVIGVGRLGGAIVRGVVDADVFSTSEVLISDSEDKLIRDLESELGVQGAISNIEVLKSVDLCVVAVEPKDVTRVLAEAKGLQTPIASVAAGVTISQMQKVLGEDYPLMRVMPNSPARVRAAMSSVCRNSAVTDKVLELCKRVFSSVGEVLELDEKNFDLITALAGSGPAFYYKTLEGLIAGGVAGGLSEESARLLAAQTMLGAARMVLDRECSPSTLREEVTTRGGCTEVGLAYLDEARLVDIFKTCIEKTAKKASELGG